MKSFETVKGGHEMLLAGRLLMVLLFLIFGWDKLIDYSGTVQYMVHVGAPLPHMAALVAIVMEVFVAAAIALGVATRPLAVLLAVYTLGTALIAHHYWSMTGMARFEAEINFYKNISIIGGLLLLYAAGPGRYALESQWQRQRSRHAEAQGLS